MKPCLMVLCLIVFAVNAIQRSGTRISELTSGSCSWAYKNGLNNIKLTNPGKGWVMIYNKEGYPIKIVNQAKPNYFMVLDPYGLKSLSWSGTQEVLCFAPANLSKGNSPYYTVPELTKPVSCSEVLNINICKPTDPEERSNDLHLMG